MFHSSSSHKLFQWSAIPFVTVGLVATGIVPFLAAVAQAGEDFGRCANDLTESGISAERAAAACSLAFRPEEMSECVVDVTSVSSVAPETALLACSRDRRPDEVATCVSDIHDQLAVSNSTSVLVLCHRSLLPERYAECVTGLAESLEYTVEQSLSSCIRAGFRPEDITPVLIPSSPNN